MPASGESTDHGVGAASSTLTKSPGRVPMSMEKVVLPLSSVVTVAGAVVGEGSPGAVSLPVSVTILSRQTRAGVPVLLLCHLLNHGDIVTERDPCHEVPAWPGRTKSCIISTRFRPDAPATEY